MIGLANGQTALLRRRTSRLTYCWRLKISDGTWRWLTTHDQMLNLSFAPFFDPQPGLSASANRRVSGLSSRTTELAGLVGTGGITYDDLVEGRLWGSQFDQAGKDWAFDWLGGFMWNAWYVTDFDYDDREWRVQLAGITSRLRAKRGEVFSRMCQNQLGVNERTILGLPSPSTCAVKLSTWPYKVADALVIDDSTTGGEDPTKRKVYVEKTGGPSGSGFQNTEHTTGDFSIGYFKHGYVNIQDGPLAGMQESIAVDADLGSSTRSAGIRAITFLRPLPRILAVGTKIDVYTGCDKTIATCVDKFDAAQGSAGDLKGGFRGFPEIPGTDRATTYPPAPGQ